LGAATRAIKPTADIINITPDRKNNAESGILIFFIGNAGSFFMSQKLRDKKITMATAVTQAARIHPNTINLNKLSVSVINAKNTPQITEADRKERRQSGLLC
jgi:hypothetical protein